MAWGCAVRTPRVPVCWVVLCCVISPWCTPGVGLAAAAGTATVTGSLTQSLSDTHSTSPTETGTETTTGTATHTITQTETETETLSDTPTQSETPTSTASVTQTATRSTVTLTPSLSKSQTETDTPTPTHPTATPSGTHTATLPSATASVTASPVPTATATFTATLPTATMSRSESATRSESLSLSRSLRMGKASVVQTPSVYRNTQRSLDIAGWANVTIVSFPEGYGGDEGIEVEITPVSLKLSFEPAFLTVPCCNTTYSGSLRFFGLSAGHESIEWRISPGRNSTAHTAPVSALWEDLPLLPASVLETIQIGFSGYAFFKGIYPDALSPELSVGLTSHPQRSLRLVFYVSGMVLSGAAEKSLYGSDYSALNEDTAASLGRPAVEFHPVSLLFLAGGVKEMPLKMTCIHPGVFTVSYVLSGEDSPELYSGGGSFKLTCLAPVPLVLTDLNEMPPFVGSESRFVEIALGARHRDYQSFTLEITCTAELLTGGSGAQQSGGATTETATLAATATAGVSSSATLTQSGVGNSSEDGGGGGNASAPMTDSPLLGSGGGGGGGVTAAPPVLPLMEFTPPRLVVRSEAGGRFTFKARLPGEYRVVCSDGGNTEFADPSPLSFHVLDKVPVVPPYVPTVRVLSDGQAGHLGVSPIIYLDVVSPPRIALTVRLFGDNLKVVPQVLEFDPQTSSLGFRLYTEWNESYTRLNLEFSGASADDFRGVGPIDVNVTGPNPLCSAYTTELLCMANWDEMCWWTGSSCRNDLMSLTPPTYSPQYEGEPIPHAVALPAKVRDGVTLRVSGGYLDIRNPALQWEADGWGSRSYVVTGHLLNGETGDFSNIDVHFHLFGPDSHRFAPVPSAVLRVLRLLTIQTPLEFSGELPFVYVGATSPSLTVSLQKPPGAFLSITPTVDVASGVTFSPATLSFTPGVSRAVYSVKAAGVLGSFNVTWLVQGADALHYVTPLWKILKVLPTNAVSVPPLPTVGDDSWSLPQRVHITRAPFTTLHLVVRARVAHRGGPFGPVVQVQECSEAGVPIAVEHPQGEVEAVEEAAAPSNASLVFSPEVVTRFYRVRGLSPGVYHVDYEITGDESANFKTPASQLLRVHDPAVWGGTLAQTGVDPQCRVAIGRRGFNKLGLSDASGETCSISDPFEPSELCQMESKTDCDNELRLNGRPCVWIETSAGVGTCQYGLPSGNVTHYSVGGSHSIFRLLDGTVWTAGSNDFGQLGHSCNGAEGCTDSPTFREVLFENRDPPTGACLDTATSATGVITCRRVSAPDLTWRSTADYVVSVLAGESHTLALTAGGRLYAWGANNHGQLGVAPAHQPMVTTPHIVNVPERPVVERLTCVAVGAYHTVALSDVGKVYAWGWNYYGQLGDAVSYRGSQREPVLITGAVLSWATDIPVAVAAGDYHTVVGTLSGKVFTWGRNNYGQLGREGFDSVVPSLADVQRPPAVFHGGAKSLPWGCTAAQKISDKWPSGIDFTLGRVEPTVYQRR